MQIVSVSRWFWVDQSQIRSGYNAAAICRIWAPVQTAPDSVWNQFVWYAVTLCRETPCCYLPRMEKQDQRQRPVRLCVLSFQRYSGESETLECKTGRFRLWGCKGRLFLIWNQRNSLPAIREHRLCTGKKRCSSFCPQSGVAWTVEQRVLPVHHKSSDFAIICGGGIPPPFGGPGSFDQPQADVAVVLILLNASEACNARTIWKLFLPGTMGQHFYT